MKTRLIVALLVLGWLLPANNLGASDLIDKYYPLKPDLTWTYSVTSDKSASGKIVVTNLPAKEVGGITVTPRKWDMGSMVKYYLMAKDNMGIYRYGEQKSENEVPVLTKPKVYSLRDPVATGTTWDITTKMGGDDLTVNLTIESVGDEMKVPAGTFKDCVTIKHTGGSKKDGAAISLEAYEWYAPDVGLVKSIVTIKKLEKGQTKSAEHLNYQLESFKP